MNPMSFSRLLREGGVRGWDGENQTVYARKDFIVSMVLHYARSLPFDRDWYLHRYADVAQAVRDGEVVDPHDHFVRHGFFEDRISVKPAIDFESYLNKNPDLEFIRSSDNPGQAAFDHFVQFGFKEGREIE